MSLYCHPTLLAHLQAGVTTTCLLYKIIPNDPEFPTVGLCELDRDITYDDLTGSLTYNGATGYSNSAFVSTTEKETGASQAEGLVSGPEFDLPLSEDEVERGVYDYAEYQVYLINYLDVTAGRHALIDSGNLGRMRMQDGVIFFGEMRSLGDKLRQSVVHRDSRLCRARFGTQPGQERFPCMVNLAPLWKPFTISSVSVTEPDRIFVAAGAGVAQPDGTYIQGMVRFTTGQNAGRSFEIEQNLATGETRLRFPTRWNIDPSDTGEIRIGCRKRFIEDCIGVHNNGLFFRGEPHSPTGDTNALNVPGVQTDRPGGSGSVATGGDMTSPT